MTSIRVILDRALRVSRIPAFVSEKAAAGCPTQALLGWVRTTELNDSHHQIDPVILSEARSAQPKDPDAAVPPTIGRTVLPAAAAGPIRALPGWVCAFLLALPLLSSSAQPTAPKETREIRVLAAADLQPVLPALADQFQHETGIHVVASYGSSATLTTQILNGAPADLFLAADFSFPEQIVAAHKADTPEPVAYARGALALWARKDSPLQPLTQNTLRDAKFTSLAIANPDHAPYGRAAVAALTWMKLYEQLKPKIVQAENIAQTAQFVESGNAQLGLISLTSASTPHMQQTGSFIRIPPDTYPELRQCAVIILKSPHSTDAHRFLDWLRSPAVQQILPKLGLDPAQ